jgi:WD40 repeat protein
MTVRISNTIAFIVGEVNRHSLWIANMDGSGEKRILDEVSGDLSSDYEWKNRVAWSPDGQWLAVNRYGGLWVLSPDGDDLTEIVPANWGQGQEIRNFAWSPDGSSIAFLQRTENSTYYLGIVHLASRIVEYIFDEPGLAWRLSWSPDNQWIALTDYYSLQVTNVKSKTVLSLEYGCQGAMITDLAWSPESERLAIVEVGNGRYAHGDSCITTLDGQKYFLDVGGSSGMPVWVADGENVYVDAINFNPDDPDLERDPRILLFGKTGNLIKRLDIATEIGDIPEVSPDGQQLLSWIPDNQNWFQGQVQITCLIEGQECSKRVRVPNMVGRLVNGDDLNAPYVWATDSQNALFLSVKDLIYTIDLHYGSVFAFDGQANTSKRITNDHEIKYVAVSPILEQTTPLTP